MRDGIKYTGGAGAFKPLTQICQESIVSTLRKGKFHPRLINDVAKSLSLFEHLLEPILRSLMTEGAITDVALIAFLAPNRRTLEISGISGVRSSTLKLIGFYCTNLVELNASGCVLMSNSIVRSVLCGCRCLERLVLDHCQRVTDAAFNPHESPFEAFAAAGQIKILSLRGCPQITGVLCAVLRKHYRSLHTLVLSQCKQLLSSTIRELLYHDALSSVDVSFIETLSDEAFQDNIGLSFTDSKPATAVTKSAVTNLSLCKSRITDASLLYMGTHLTNLCVLKMQWCSAVSDNGMEALVRGCASLRVLDLKSCSGVTDGALEHVARHCSELDLLDVSWCSAVTDRGMLSLASAGRLGALHSLRSLHCSWCPEVTSDSLSCLTDISSLRVLESCGNTLSADCIQKLTDAGIDVRIEISLPV